MSRRPPLPARLLAPRWRASARASARWRVLAPFALLLALMLGSALGGVRAISRETDRIDTLRTREALGAAVEVRVKRLQFIANNNAIGTPTVRATADPIDMTFLTGDLGAFSESKQLDTVLVLDLDGRGVIGFRDGRRLPQAALAAAAAQAHLLARRLPLAGEGATGGLVTRAGATSLIGVANIVPYGPDRTPALMALPQRRLVMAQAADERLVDQLNEIAKVEGLRLSGARDPERSIDIAVYPGQRLSLSWPSRGLGERAMRRALVYIAPAFALGVLLLGFALRSSLAATRALEALALEDRLTGLPNRPAFLAELDRRLRAGGGVALGMVDLNGFKAINDTHGHLAGDDLLRAVGDEFAAIVRTGEMAARLGGDEFAFLTGGEAAAQRIARDLTERLERPLEAGALRLTVGAAVGIAAAQPGMAARDLIALADARLYRDKAGRRADGDDRPPTRVAARAVVAL